MAEVTGQRALATVELLGALAYGQLRAFEVSTRSIRLAPDTAMADAAASFALREHAAYARLTRRLGELTQLPTAVMDRHRPRLDAFFDQAPLADWLGLCAFFAVGLPLASDFAREVAPVLDDRTAAVVVGALADREPYTAFATAELERLMAAGDAPRDRARSMVTAVIGHALTGYSEALGDTDALDVLLTPDQHADQSLSKRVGMRVLEAHRRRMHRMGLEDLD